MLKIIRVLGQWIMFLAILMNPYFIEHFFSQDQNIVTISIIWGILFFQIVILLCGFLMYKKCYLISKTIIMCYLSIKRLDMLILKITKLPLLLIKWLFKKRKELLLLLITIIFCVFISEIISRIYYATTYSGLIEDINKNSTNPINHTYVGLGEMVKPSIIEDIIYEFKPHLDIYFMNASVQTNSHGWRENEIPTKKEDKTIRIIGLGDSFMFGWGVNESERYMDILEKELNQKYPKFNWQTLVFAVPGYNLNMEIEVLKNHALKYDPDIIIYGFVENDHCLPNFIQTKKDVFSSNSFLLDQFRNYFGIKKAISHLINPFENVGAMDLCSPDKVSRQYKDSVGEEVFNNKLKDFEIIGQNLDIPIIFFWANPYIERFEIPSNMVEIDPQKEQFDYLKANLITFASLVQSDRGDYGHPSVLGHKILGENLFKQFVKKEIVNDLISKVK